MKLKKEIDAQMEQAISQYPIATKSELDELYKIIYDLKKEVKALKKELEQLKKDAAPTDVKTAKSEVK